MSSIIEDQSFGDMFVDSIKEWVVDQCAPGALYPKNDLESWAEDNDYVTQAELDEALNKIDDLEDQLKDALLKEN